MNPLNQSTLADLNIRISWKKDDINHHEEYLAKGFNFYRDVFPGTLLESHLDFSDKKDHPDKRSVHFTAQPGELLPPFDEKRVVTRPRKCVRSDLFTGEIAIGRFYPSGIFSEIPWIFKENQTPCRVIDIKNERITVDFNHPLAREPLKVHLTVLNPSSGGREERGGGCTDWFELALEGPGLQTASPLNLRYASKEKTLDEAFEREDEASDAQFYEVDRLVHHIDTTASRNLSQIYEKSLSKSDAVLDLMSGWVSHLPPNIPYSNVTGLGMNRNEMEKNPQLTDVVVHDLNQDPTLPFESNHFDQVICSLSIEYLTQPLTVFDEVARVLKPGGRLSVGFSNRWFPEKVTHCWKTLHEFERIGLVLDFFKASGQFEALETYSVRGYPRPMDDKYADRLLFSDPIYGVTGRTMA